MFRHRLRTEGRLSWRPLSFFVRLAAKSLLHRLLEEHPRVLVQDWYKDGQSKRKVLSAVEEVLHTNLPESYDRVLFKEKCDNVFYLMLDYASHGRKWAV